MTLVIRDKMQTSDLSHLDENYLFDQEQFNFIINRRTCFTCDQFVGNNYEKLQYVLKSLEAIDPVLLEQLNYYYNVSQVEKMLGLLMSYYGAASSEGGLNKSMLGVSSAFSAAPMKRQASIAPSKSGLKESKFGSGRRTAWNTMARSQTLRTDQSLLIARKKKMTRA